MKLHGALYSILLMVCFAMLPLTAQETATEPRVDFATYLSGNTKTHIAASALDRNGNLYVTGITNAGDFPTTAGAFRRTPRQVCNNGSCGFTTAFVTKLSRNGRSLVYSTFLNEGVPLDIAVDVQGNAYVTGPIVDPDYTGTVGAWRTKCRNPIANATNQFCDWLVKLTASGSSLIYSTLIDDVSHCFNAQRIKVNAVGEVYIAGTSLVDAPPASGGECPTTPGAYRRTVTGSQTGTIVMKFNANGSQIVFSTWVSGPSPRDHFGALAVAANDHVVVVGNTSDANFPTTQTAFQRANEGSSDAYIAKLSSDGSTLLASTVLGGATNNEEATSVAVDSALNVYVAGTTSSSDFPTTAGAYRRKLDTQNCNIGPGGFEPCTDLFVAKLPPDFSRLTFSTFLGGNGQDFAPDLAIDTVGHVFLTGPPTRSHPLVKPVETNFRSIYVTKLNTGGSGLLFSTYFGGAQRLDGSLDIEVDDAGNAYIAGNSTGTDLPTTENAYQIFNHSDGEAGFMAKFDIPPCTLGSTIPSVTICTPASSASISSPVLIAAGTTDDQPITGMVVYVDSVKKFTISNASHFDTRISMGAGTHQLIVKAWDADGRILSSSRTISVQ